VTNKISPLILNITWFRVSLVKEIMNMKKLNVTLAILVAAVMAGNAQTPDPIEVKSQIVGYNTITAAGNGGSGIKYSFLAVNLLNSPEFAGPMDGSLVCPPDSFTPGQFNQGTTYAKYYVELTNGTNAGSQADIVSNTSDTLTVVANSEFQAAVESDATIEIRKHRTLSDVFGGASGTTSATDVLLAKGSTLGAADNVMIYEGGSYKNFFYSSNALRPGWRDAAGAVATDRPIYPSQGIIVARKSNTEINAVVVGTVKTGVALIDLDAGYTLCNLPAPADATLPSIFGGASGAANATDVKIAKGATLGAADNILIAGPTGAYDTYFYSSNALRPGWRNSAGVASSAVNISGGIAMFIKKVTPATLAVTQVTND
jgi:uncharacterized protein (TIGR02597 family)